MSIRDFKMPEDTETLFWSVWGNLPVQVKIKKMAEIEGEVVFLVESVTGGVFQVDQDTIWREPEMAIVHCKGTAIEVVEKAQAAELDK